MSLGQEYGNRIVDNIAGVFVAIIAGAFAVMGETMAEVTEPTGSISTDGSINTIPFMLQNYPAIIVLVGFAVVIISAGPFGIIGFLFEVAGANIFLTDPIAGFMLFGMGAAIIVGGTRLWSWASFIKWALSNRQNGGRRRGRRLR